MLENWTKALPSQPNIIGMVDAFADCVPSFSDSMNLYLALFAKTM